MSHEVVLFWMRWLQNARGRVENACIYVASFKVFSILPSKLSASSNLKRKAELGIIEGIAVLAE